MAYTIIHRKDKEKLSSMMNEMLSLGGRIMSYIDEMSDDMGERYGDRDGMGMRDGGSRGGSYGDRDLDYPYDMYERRRRR